MEEQPILKTSRLTLRPFESSDAPRVQQLAGDRRVSEMTANIPYPYKDGMAEKWISSHAASFVRGEAIVYAVTLSHTGELIGAVSLTELTNGDGGLGFWIGFPYWGNGYCTEAVKALIEFGMGEYGLTSVDARHLRENRSSGRVILKNGFQYQGTVSMDVNGENRVLDHYEKGRQGAQG